MTVDKDGILKNSFALNSRASFVIKIKTKKDLVEAVLFANRIGLPLLPLGSGTNLAPKPFIEAVAAEIEIKGIRLKRNTVEANAGEDWDKVVEFAVRKNLSGIEALSWIPGKTGAAPVQNIGAYGAEMKDSLLQLEVFDIKAGEFIILKNKDCAFEYRDSIFKREKGRFVIISTTLGLSEKAPSLPDYRDVKNHFIENKNLSPNLQEIRRAIIEIRKNKLPDPKIVPNCGSFFKNPFVSLYQAKRLKEKFPKMPIFEQNKIFKIPAGFLIDSLGFKGKKIGKIEVYKNNALVLTNPYGAPFQDLLFAKSEIENAVFQEFGIRLEPEVNILG